MEINIPLILIDAMSKVYDISEEEAAEKITDYMIKDFMKYLREYTEDLGKNAASCGEGRE